MSEMKIGQRWLYAAYSSKYIVEIINVHIYREKITIKIVDMMETTNGAFIYLGATNTFIPDMNYFTYLEGQDKPV